MLLWWCLRVLVALYIHRPILLPLLLLLLAVSGGDRGCPAAAGAVWRAKISRKLRSLSCDMLLLLALLVPLIERHSRACDCVVVAIRRQATIASETPAAGAVDLLRRWLMRAEHLAPIG